MSTTIASSGLSPGSTPAGELFLDGRSRVLRSDGPGEWIGQAGTKASADRFLQNDIGGLRVGCGTKPASAGTSPADIWIRAPMIRTSGKRRRREAMAASISLVLEIPSSAAASRRCWKRPARCWTRRNESEIRERGGVPAAAAWTTAGQGPQRAGIHQAAGQKPRRVTRGRRVRFRRVGSREFEGAGRESPLRGQTDVRGAIVY